MNVPLPDADPNKPKHAKLVSWRSVLLGLAGVLFICGLTPYNDFVINNTYLVGNFLPIGLLLFYVVFVMTVNAPLLKWKPRWALSSGELAVALAMTLVSCGLPSSGLMRYLPGSLIGIQYQARDAQSNEFRQLFRDLDLPNWLLPHSTSGLTSGDPVITNFVGRTPFIADTVSAHAAAVPWKAWCIPMLSWGLLLIFLYGAIVCLCVLVRRQWVENERLAFPLANIYLDLIEAPAAGRSLNKMLSSRLFWIAAAAIFFLHGLNALHQYFPHVPTVAAGYDLRGMFGNDPWKPADESFKKASIFFSVVAIAFLLRSTLSFGLFFFYLLMQVGVRMLAGLYGREIVAGQASDLMFGSTLPIAAAMLWVGRAHFLMIARQMFRGAQPGEPTGRYLSYPLCGWILVISIAGLVGWLICAGMSLAGAVVMVGIMLLLLMLVARIVAETGLVFVQFSIPLTRPWIFVIPQANGTLGLRTTLKSFFFTSWFGNLFASDMRESMPVFVSHGLRVVDSAFDDPRSSPRRGGWVIACLGLALLTGYLASGASTLVCEYAYSTTLDQLQEQPLNSFGVITQPKNSLQATIDYRPPKTGPREPYDRLTTFGSGFVITALLSVLRLRFVGWPLHPFGFLLAYTYPMKRIWFSILIGWLAKVAITRLGGSELYRRAIPLFIGMLIGESAAAAFWLLVSLVMVATGHPYFPVKLMPT